MVLKTKHKQNSDYQEMAAVSLDAQGILYVDFLDGQVMKISTYLIFSLLLQRLRNHIKICGHCIMTNSFLKDSRIHWLKDKTKSVQLMINCSKF